MFNFKAIKDASKPGSWRRGYTYFKTKGQIQTLEATDAGAKGKVKGNFKDSYTVELIFEEDLVSANCDCPVEDEWCKHSVAVGLKAIEENLWEKHLGLPFEETEYCGDLADTGEFEGAYRFVMDWDDEAKIIAVQIWDRRSQKQVKNVEPVLKTVRKMEKSGEIVLNVTEKMELVVLQYLFKNATPDPKKGWYSVAFNDQEEFLDLMSDMEEICHYPTKARITYDAFPLQPVLSVNASMAGNVMLAVHLYHMAEVPNIFPYDEIHFFGKNIAWCFYNNKIYTLVNSLQHFPKYLTKGTFYDLHDAEGGQFVFEVLPRIRQFVEVEQTEIIEKMAVKQKPPKRVLTLRRADKATIRTELEFEYNGHRVPYSKAQDANYVSVVNEEKESVYWLKRDRDFEEKAYEYLLKMNLQPMQTNHLYAEYDDAIDFYNTDLPRLRKKKWILETDDSFDDLKTAQDKLQFVAHLDFTEESVDQFTLYVTCAVGPYEVQLETVQNGLTTGKKFIMMEGEGYVEIPLIEILEFTKTLNSFDKVEVDQDTYLIKTYQAGLISEFVDQGVRLDMSPRFEDFWNLISAFNELEEIDIPNKVNADLRNYQKQGFNWLWFLYSYGLNGILADDMGLGKTLQALVLLQKAKDEDGQMPSLIVCPTSVVYNWQKECEKFTPDLTIMNLTGSERHRNLKAIKEHDVIITSYALVRRDYKILRQFNFRNIILDESQNIKNHEAQTTKAVKALKAHHRLALSGTPIENRLSELWSVFDFLMPGFLLDLDEFRYRYIIPIEEKGLRDTQTRLRMQLSPFILRRLKHDVAKDLPDKFELISYCEMLPEQQELYMEVLEKTEEEVMAQFNEKGQLVNQASVLAALLRLRQVCCHPKLLKDTFNHAGIGSGKFESMKEMIEECIDEGHRVLLFSQFVEMLEIIRRWLDVKGIPYGYLTGQTKNRQEEVDNFNRNDRIPIFLASLKAGGTGLNLTGADYVIIYDPWWNPAVEDQATDRAHRIGQTRNVFVYRIITRGTVEEKIMKLKERKRSLIDSVISVDRSMGKVLSLSDLKEILKPGF